MKGLWTFCIRGACLAALLALPMSVLASGTYVGGIPRQPGQKMDNEKLLQGKLIYTGKLELEDRMIAGSPQEASEQEAILRILAAQLPAKERGKRNLASLAGRLTPDQSDALQYYLANKYRARAPQSVNAERFFLGQAIFHGHTTGQGDAESQAVRLKRLQDQLPNTVQKQTDLTALAGKLSPEEYDALAYYVNVTYAASAE